MKVHNSEVALALEGDSGPFGMCTRLRGSLAIADFFQYRSELAFNPDLSRVWISGLTFYGHYVFRVFLGSFQGT